MSDNILTPSDKGAASRFLNPSNLDPDTLWPLPKCECGKPMPPHESDKDKCPDGWHAATYYQCDTCMDQEPRVPALVACIAELREQLADAELLLGPGWPEAVARVTGDVSNPSGVLSIQCTKLVGDIAELREQYEFRTKQVDQMAELVAQRDTENEQLRKSLRDAEDQLIALKREIL